MDIGTYFSDVYNPLKSDDWGEWIEDITRLSAIGYMTIPPIGVKWPYKMDACVMHLLPLPNEGMHGFCDFMVPLDYLIMSVADYEKKVSEDKGEFLLFTLSIHL